MSVMQTEKVGNGGLWMSCLWIKRKMRFIYFFIVVFEELFRIEQYNGFPGVKSLGEYLLIYLGLGTLVIATQIFILRQS